MAEGGGWSDILKIGLPIRRDILAATVHLKEEFHHLRASISHQQATDISSNLTLGEKNPEFQHVDVLMRYLTNHL